MQDSMCRCTWCNLKNPKYIEYHDNEWCVPTYDDHMLFELLVLESFQAGLSWECVLDKREAFRVAFDDFDYVKIAEYNQNKFDELYKNGVIIRNRLKIMATIKNAQVFADIIKEKGCFFNYLKCFWDGKTYLKTIVQHQNCRIKYQKICKKRG